MTDDRLTCPICPHACRLRPGHVGLCRARQHTDGRIVALGYGRPCSVAVDPMEKKPLYHFFPGTGILSLGMAGCNLRCKNCQNSAISQRGPLDVPACELPVEALAPLMHEQGVVSVAYTYTEPLVAYEYVRDCAEAVRAAGGRNVLVSAAYVQPEPLRRLAPLLDAANVDLKSPNAAFYRSNCRADLAPVLESLTILREAGVSLEITNLVIPGLNDGQDDIERLIATVQERLGNETPLHFSRFFPCHELAHLPPTPEATLFDAADAARRHGLHHVYVGNVRNEATRTLCSGCGTELLVRTGYTVRRNSLTPEGSCPECGVRLYGRF